MISYRSERILSGEFKWGDGGVIGFAGKMRSGKDTCGNYFAQKFNFERIAFADPLKRKAMEDFNLTNEQVFGDHKSAPDFRYPYVDSMTKKPTLNADGTARFWTPRELMQYIGGIYRAVDPDFWIKQLDKQYKTDIKNYSITDVRFPNEAAYARDKRGGLIVLLKRSLDLKENINSLNDISETSMDNYVGVDYVIENNYVDFDPLFASLAAISKEIDIHS